VNVHGVSTLFPPPPPPLSARLSRRWTFMVFRQTVWTRAALSRTPHTSIRATTTSLACKSEPEVNVHGVSMSFPPSSTSLVRQIEPTSQYCTAMSFDTRNAIARFLTIRSTTTTTATASVSTTTMTLFRTTMNGNNTTA